jgi:branched-chain amino acid transport system substrate-binding protein
VAEEKYARGDLDFTSQLFRIRSANPDILIEWSRYTEQALISKQRRAMGLNVLHGAGDGTPKYLELAGDAAEGVIYPTDFAEATAKSGIGRELLTKVRNEYKRTADYVHAQAYDAVKAVVLALEKAGAPDKAKLRDGLRAIEFDGARGRFKFDRKGDPTHSAAMIMIRGGKETDASE